PDPGPPDALQGTANAPEMRAEMWRAAGGDPFPPRGPPLRAAGGGGRPARGPALSGAPEARPAREARRQDREVDAGGAERDGADDAARRRRPRAEADAQLAVRGEPGRRGGAARAGP